MRRSSALIAAIASIVLTQSAFAADIPSKARVSAPPPAPVYNWTGFYLGVNGGYGWGDASGGSIEALDAASAIFLSGPPAFFTPEQFNSSINSRGAILGGQLGFNWQLSPTWVAGLEADIQWANVNGDSSHVLFLNPSFFGSNFPFTVDTEHELKWFGTVRGRIGFLWTPDLWIYGTGGLAFGRTEASASILSSPAAGTSNSISISSSGVTFSCASIGPQATACYAGSESRTSLGWAAGAGFEYRVAGNWTAKLEYLHVDLQDQTITLVSPPPSSSGVAMKYKFDAVFDIVRAGINYKF